MIKTAGANVSPSEVEQAIAKVTGGAVAHVFGIADPDRGQAVAAVIAADNEAEFDEATPSSPTRQPNCRHTRSRSGSPFVPSGELPLLASGKARRAADEKAVRCLTPSTIWCGPRCSIATDKPMVIDPDRRAELSRTRLHAQRIWPLASSSAGVGKGTRVGLIMPNGVRWVQVAIALTRIGAVLVPLSTLLPARELVAQLRTASVQFLISVEEFRGHRYLDDLASISGSAISAAHCSALNFLRCARFGRPTGCRRSPAILSSTRVTADGDTERHDGHHVHLRQQRRTQGRAALARQRARRGPRPAWQAAASMPTPACTCRCPFSGSAASAAACCPRWWPGRR